MAIGRKLAGLAGLAAAVYALVLRPRMDRWGAVICQDHGTRALPRPRDHLAAAVSSWGVRRDPSS